MENNSKQAVLSIVGIAVLVIAVVGVSFAFFTYSKAGTQNNTLTTGSIFFNFTEGNAINLTNEFPRSDTSGKALSADNNAALTFHVLGYDGSGKGITYTVLALPGDTMSGQTRFKDSEIKFYLTGTSSNSSTITNNYSTPKAVGANGSLTANGITLATGKITATAVGSQQDDTYTLRMWISDTVTLGESGATYTPTAFSKLYYSVKLKVVANTAA